MSLPNGISLCTVTLGYDTSWLGNDAVITGTLNADRPVIWQATGTRISNGNDVVPNASGQLVFQVPHVDQDGFIDQAGNVVKNWLYTLNAQVSKGGVNEPIRRNFQVFVGQETVDLDLVADGPTQPGFTAPMAQVTSVNGRTGAVTADQLASDLSATFVPRPSGGTDGQALIKNGTGTVWGDVATGGGSGNSGSSLLAVSDFGPGQGGGFTATTTMSPIGGGAGRSIVFAAPPSGTVVIRLTGAVFYKQVGQANYRWALVDHAAQANLVSSVAQLSFNRVSVDDDPFGRREMQTAVFVVSGLTAGTTYTYDWAHQRTGSSGQINLEIGISDADNTHATMEVYGVGGPDLAPYARRAVAQTISGAWNFTTAPTINGAPIGSGGGSGGTAPGMNLIAPPIMAAISNLFHGGSSIAVNTESAPFLLFGKSGADGRVPYGVFGHLIKAVNTYGAGGHDSIDSLGRGTVLDGTVQTTFIYHDALTNDLQKLDASQVPTTDKLNRFKNFWRAILARYFAGATTPSESGTFTKNGTWTQQSSPSLSSATTVNQGTGFYVGEKRFVTTTQNDTITFAVPTGSTSLWILLSGVDSSQAGYSGAAYSVSGAGLSSPITGTTNDKITRSQSFGADVATIAVKVTGLTPGQTLTLTKTDANGTSLGFEGIARIPANYSPGPFVIVKCYPGGGQAAAAQAAIGDALDQVIAEFSPPPNTIIVLDPKALGFNANGDMMADGLHPNRYGHLFMRNKAWAAIGGITSLNGEPINP